MERKLQHDIGKRRPFELPEEEAFLNIARTGATLEAGPGTLLKTHGLTSSTYNALRILRGDDGKARRCSEIGRDMVVRVPDVTRLVDRLIAMGLAQRERSADDRRAVEVRITAKGLETLAAIDGPLREIHRAQLGHMSREELSELSRLLALARAPRRAAPIGKGD